MLFFRNCKHDWIQTVHEWIRLSHTKLKILKNGLEIQDDQHSMYIIISSLAHNIFEETLCCPKYMYVN
jgi:hypothetical protein